MSLLGNVGTCNNIEFGTTLGDNLVEVHQQGELVFYTPERSSITYCFSFEELSKIMIGDKPKNPWTREKFNEKFVGYFEKNIKPTEKYREAVERLMEEEEKAEEMVGIDTTILLKVKDVYPYLNIEFVKLAATNPEMLQQMIQIYLDREESQTLGVLRREFATLMSEENYREAYLKMMRGIDSLPPTKIYEWALYTQTFLDQQPRFSAAAVIDLSHKNMPNTDFRGRDLRGANLSHSNFAGSNFKGVDLTGSYLLYSNLNQANLSGANLTNAVLKGSHLMEANLRGANLTNADLVQADLSRAQLGGAKLEKADLWKANLNHASLGSVNLMKADLTEVNLRHAFLRGTNFENSNLEGADLADANLNGAILRNVGLEGANLERANLSSAALSKATLTDANLTNADLSNASLTGADLTRADLTGANLRHAKLRGADLNSINLMRADLTEVDLTGADLEGANLTNANLTGADLTHTNLTDTNFNGSILKRVNFTNVTLDSTRFRRVDLTDAYTLIEGRRFLLLDLLKLTPDASGRITAVVGDGRSATYIHPPE